MKYLCSQQPITIVPYAFRNGPETHADEIDPLHAVRSGVADDLADLQSDVAETADEESTVSKALTAVAEGPLVGPIRLLLKMRQENEENE